MTGDTHSAGKPFPLCDLWLAVDEEQTLHFGLRRAWHWLEASQHTAPHAWQVGTHMHPALEPAARCAQPTPA